MSERVVSRRVVLNSIVALGRGGIMLPVAPALAQALAGKPRGLLRGSVTDGATGALTTAKIRICDAVTGEANHG